MLVFSRLSRRWMRSSRTQRRSRARASHPARGARARVILLLIGWTLATGAHWDLLQVATWGRMWVGYARVQPLATALVTTFSPDAMCGACKSIQAAKLDQNGNPAVDLSAIEKAFLLLPSLRPLQIEAPPPLHFAREGDFSPLVSWRPAPPVPPPRVATALPV